MTTSLYVETLCKTLWSADTPNLATKAVPTVTKKTAKPSTLVQYFGYLAECPVKPKPGAHLPGNDVHRKAAMAHAVAEDVEQAALEEQLDARDASPPRSSTPPQLTYVDGDDAVTAYLQRALQKSQAKRAKKKNALAKRLEMAAPVFAPAAQLPKGEEDAWETMTIESRAPSRASSLGDWAVPETPRDEWEKLETPALEHSFVELPAPAARSETGDSWAQL